MTKERWTHTLYNGKVQTATITFDGLEYRVDSADDPSLFHIYKSYTWAKKSLERFGFELADTKIVLGANNDEGMTREQAQTKVNAHNEELKNYKENEMLATLGVKDGQKVSASEWFSLYNQAYNLLDAYYKKGMAVLEECRANGHDVKINMQTYELILY